MLYSAWNSHPMIPKHHKTVPKYEKCAGVQLQYVLVHTISNNVISEYTCMYKYVQVQCDMYHIVPSYTCMYYYILVRTNMAILVGGVRIPDVDIMHHHCIFYIEAQFYDVPVP